MYFIIVLIIFLIDQLTKWSISNQVQLHESIPVIQDVFHITYSHNYGAAFSSMQNMQGLLITIVSIASIVIVIVMIKNRKKANKMFMIGLALILSGGLGNLVDRIRLGYVVDFLDFRIWPIFNVADMAVVSGCILLIIYIAILEPRSQKKKDLAGK